MFKKICRMRYFIKFAVVLTVLMSVYGIIRFHYKNITVSNTTPVNYEGFKILFEDGSCKKISLPANISAQPYEKIVLKNTLTEQMSEQTVAFRTTNCNVVVKLDGESIYEYNQNGSAEFVKSPGNLWHFVTLPNDYEQGNLAIELTSPYKNLGGRVTNIVWGARSACILSFMYSEWFHVLLGFALFIIGIVFLVFYYVLGHLKMQNTGIFYFSFAILLFAVNIMQLSGMLQIFYGNSVMYYIIGYSGLYLSFIAYIVFLSRTMFKAEGVILRTVSIVYILFYSVIIVLQWIGIADMAQFSLAVWIINMCILALLILFTIQKIVAKNFTTIEPIVAMLALLEIIFVVYDYVNYNMQRVGIRHYGMVLLFMVPACHYIYKAVHMYRQELDEKMQLNNQAMQSLAEGHARMSRKIEKLEQEKEAAVDMNNMKSVFLGNVAEKLLMPMSRIIGMDELILRDELNDSTRELAGSIQSEASIMLTLINNIVDYSKVENGELEIKPVAYHMDNLLYDMCDIVSVGIIDKSIDFIVDFSPNIPRELMGDEIRLRQILTNVLSNAVRYTTEGTIRFKVESDLTDADEVLLTIVISDTGIGMEVDELHKLFENFLMSDATSLAGHKGTGLGLAVCKRLVELMNGSIKVESTLGEGSVFTITIPQKIINGMPIVEVEKSNYKVLIFETNKLQRMMMKKTCMDLEIEADFIHDENEFKDAILSNVYRTVIICEDEYVKYKDYLASDVCAGIRTVVLVDVSAAVTSYENAELLQRPVQCMNLYDAISGNDIVKPIEVNHVQKFIAPLANVLIVDDNPSNLKICMAMLEPYKMNITTCLSGKECMEVLENQPVFDMVLLDYSMPEMSGSEIISRIRELNDKYYKTLPVIAMTAQQINGAKELFVAEGFDNYIDKPFEAMHLEKILETYIPEEKLLHSENINE